MRPKIDPQGGLGGVWQGSGGCDGVWRGSVAAWLAASRAIVGWSWGRLGSILEGILNQCLESFRVTFAAGFCICF